VPQAAKTTFKSKEVQDGNFTSEYMYPVGSKKPDTPQLEQFTAMESNVSTESNITEPTVLGMRKSECIQMIGQEKFDKYAQIFGSEISSIKRCVMLKAVRK
jgi:hypothetical protein